MDPDDYLSRANKRSRKLKDLDSSQITVGSGKSSVKSTVTNTSSCADTNATKNSQCEIVSGPTFQESKKYWQNLVVTNPSKNPTKLGLAFNLSSYPGAVPEPEPEIVLVDETPHDITSLTELGLEHDRSLSQEEIEVKLKQVHYAQVVVSDQIQQTEKALNVALHGKANNMVQEVELLQQLAVLRERRRAYYLEVGRLSTTASLHYVFPRAKIHFYKISVDVVRRLTVAPHHHCFLFALVRYQDQVSASRAVYINDIVSRDQGSVDFSDNLELVNVSPDCSITVEIFGLRIIRKENSGDKRFNIRRLVSSPSPEKRAHAPELFSMIGQIVVHRDQIHGSVHQLSPYEFPLAGHIRIHSTCEITDLDDDRGAAHINAWRT